jgi:pimeloyl-ACP methyl ester carboxylesterase
MNVSHAGWRIQPTPMPNTKTLSRPIARTPVSGRAQPPTVSGRWLLAAIGWTVLAAALCAWGTLCLLFWQGSWQLLYHPSAKVARTPVRAGVAFSPVEFAATETGVLRLQGWWIPAPPLAPLSGYTVLYFHGRNGNLGDSVDALAALHEVGVNVLAFDYRGYGQSKFVRPSEAHWRQDAEWALQYLTETRQIDPRTIVLDGSGLGANLALEIAAAHPSLAGVVLNSPLENPMQAIFGDARARLVPAHLLVRDRYALNGPAASLRIPSLWVLPVPEGQKTNRSRKEPEAFQKVSVPKTLVWQSAPGEAGKNYTDELFHWLADLPPR